METNAQAVIPADQQLAQPRINAEAVNLIGQAAGWLQQWKARPPLASVEEHARAVAGRKTLGEAKRQLKQIEGSHTLPYKAAIDAIRSFFQSAEENIAATIKIADASIQAFEAAERARQAELERQARAQREAEAKRLREEAEALRRAQAEAEARAQEEAAALEAAGRVDAADDKLNETIAQAAQVVNEIETAEMLAEVIEHAPITYSAPLAKGGLRRTTHYSATVTDARLVVEAWLRGELPSIAVQVNEQFFNQQARTLKETFSFPGVALKTESRIGG
jgi:hypothetical protein